jgi:DNA-binding NarL/FixJ family response regulator
LDGEPIFFDCLKLLLSDTKFVVVRSLDETLDEFGQIRTLRPDLVLTDVRPPTELRALQSRLAADCLDVPFILLRLDAMDALVDLCISEQVGSGFLSRSAASATFLTALEIVEKGGTFIDPILKLAAEERAQPENVIKLKPDMPHPDPANCLSKRERDVLYSVALGNSSKEIATKMGLSCKTVDTYKSRAMQKLDLSDRTSIVRYALENDWFNELIAELKQSQDELGESVA